jgi:hypothetical protein
LVQGARTIRSGASRKTRYHAGMKVGPFFSGMEEVPALRRAVGRELRARNLPATPGTVGTSSSQSVDALKA